MEKIKVDIPEDLQQICRELAQVARKHELGSLSGKFQPLMHPWHGEISFSWESGRHMEDAGEIRISSQFFVHTKIDEKKG